MVRRAGVWLSYRYLHGTHKALCSIPITAPKNRSRGLQKNKAMGKVLIEWATF